MGGPFVCLICHYETELDDVMVAPHAGRCICARCFYAEVENVKKLPTVLRREIERLVNLAGAS